MPLTYPVDYTGVNPTNKVDNEFQLLSSANFGNYKVIIPDYTPFYGIGVTVTKQNGSVLLTEGVDYVLTHYFSEASHSIGRAVYGSISINQAITGTLIIDYQTLGGSWNLPSNKIAYILGNLFYNPRIARWEQVAGYPALFPAINHDHSADDLVGMADVVTAIQGIKAAVDTAYAGYAASFATEQQAIDGILTNKTMSPSTTNVVLDLAKIAINAEMRGADAVINANTSALASDILGDATFINDGYKVEVDGGSWRIFAGTGYVNGRRVVQPNDLGIVVSTYPTDVYMDAYDVNGTMVTGITTKAGQSITNLVRYSEDFSNDHWYISGSIYLFRNRSYNGNGLRTIDQLIFQSFANEVVQQTLLTESISSGTTYIASAWVKGGLGSNRNLRIKLGDSGPTTTIQLPLVAQRVSFPLIAGDDKQLAFSMQGAVGGIDFGEVQLQSSTTNHNLILNGNELSLGTWTLVNSTILNNNLTGPYDTSSPCAKLSATATTGIHGIRTGNLTLIGGQAYQFSCYVRGEVAVPNLAITVTGVGGDTDTVVFVLAARTFTGAGSLLVRDISITEISNFQTAQSGYSLIQFTIVPIVSTTYTIQFNQHNGTTTSFLGVVGDGIWIGDVALLARGFSANLLQHSADFADGAWDKPAAIIKPDLNGSLIVATALSEEQTLVADVHVAKQQIAHIRASTAYTFSAEFRAADYLCGFLRVRSGPNAASINQDMELLFNIANIAGKRQTVTGGGWTGVSSSVTSIGDGWYRAIISGTAPTGTFLGEVQVGPAISDAAGGQLFIGDGVKGISVRNAYYVVGNSVTGYVAGDSYPVSKYVSTAFMPRTDNDGGTWPPYTDMGVTHFPIKIATIVGPGNIIDRRNAIRRVKGIIKNGVNNAIPISTLTLMEPSLRYFVSNNASALIPSAETLAAGDMFYLSKALGSSYFLRVENAVDDRIYFRDAYTDEILSEVEIVVNIDRDITILFDGTSFTLY